MPLALLLLPLVAPVLVVGLALAGSAVRNRYNAGAERVTWSVWWAQWLAWGLAWLPVLGAVVAVLVVAVLAVVAVWTFPRWWPVVVRWASGLSKLGRVASWVV